MSSDKRGRVYELQPTSSFERQEHSLSSDTKEPAVTAKKKPLLSRILSWNWRNVIIAIFLWTAYLACNASFSIIGPFFPEEAGSKGVSPLVIGIITGCPPLVMAVLVPIIGYFLPQIGFFLPVLFGLLIVGCSYIALGFVILIPSTPGFIVACVALRLMEGVGTAFFVTATYFALPLLFPQQANTMVALVELATGFGYAIGPIIGGLLYVAGGYPLPFVAVGCAVLVLAVPCTLLVWNLNPREEYKPTLPLNAVINITTDPVFIVLVLSVILGIGSLSFFVPILEPFLINVFKVSNLDVALLFFIGAVIFMITALIIGKLVDKFGNNRIVTISGIFVTASGFLATGVIPNPSTWYIFILCISFLGTGVGPVLTILPVFPDMVSLAKSHTKKGDNEDLIPLFVSAVVTSSLFFGEFFGNLVGGLLNNFLSFYQSSFLFAELLIAEGLVLLGVSIISRYIRL